MLAFEVTKLVHGEEEAMKAQDAAQALFAGGGSSENVPTYPQSPPRMLDGGQRALTSLLAVDCGLCASRAARPARPSQGRCGLCVGDEKVTDVE